MKNDFSMQIKCPKCGHKFEITESLRFEIEKNYEEFLMGAVGADSIVFDIGANIGYYTIQFGRKTTGKGRVYAFEPCSYQYELLNRNIQLNSLSNINVQKKIVTDESSGNKRIYFSGMENTGSSSLEVESDHYEDVECVTVDELCSNEGIQSIDVVKIDVEGHELGVVKGMASMLAAGEIQHLLLEINNFALEEAGSSAKEIVDYLNKFDYRPQSIASGNLTEYVIGTSESLVYFSKKRAN
jgi:FkbM family methyltransferase